MFTLYNSDMSTSPKRLSVVKVTTMDITGNRICGQMEWESH